MRQVYNEILILNKQLRNLRREVDELFDYVTTLQRIAARLTVQGEKDQQAFMRFLAILTKQPPEIQEAIRKQAEEPRIKLKGIDL